MTDVFSIFENFTLSDSFDILVVSLISSLFSTVQGLEQYKFWLNCNYATLYWMSLLLSFILIGY